MKINFPITITAADTNKRTISGTIVSWNEAGNTSAGKGGDGQMGRGLLRPRSQAGLGWWRQPKPASTAMLLANLLAIA